MFASNCLFTPHGDSVALDRRQVYLFSILLRKIDQLGTEQNALHFDQSRNIFIRLGTEQTASQLDQSRKLFILPSTPQ
jgi:hypothetical protein